MRTTFAQVSAALAVGAITASEEYRVLMEGCEILSSIWNQRLVVVVVFSALYALVAYQLLAVAVRGTVAPRSWKQAGLSVVLACAFGGVALALAPVAAVVTDQANIVGSPVAVAVAKLDSYPNLAGAILGSFVFLLVCMSAVELKNRRWSQAAGHDA